MVVITRRSLLIAPFFLHSGMFKLIIAALLLPCWAFSQQIVTVPAAPYERKDVPVYLTLKRPADKHYGLRNNTNSHVYALQWEGDTAVFIASDPIPAHQEVAYTLLETKKRPQPVHLDQSASTVTVRKGKQTVFVYNIAEVMPPADSPSYYKRSGFIHPLYTPAGKVVTDAFPSNHAHQHAVFHAWTNTRFKGHHVDFWNQHKLEGTVGNAKLIRLHEGPVYSEMVTKQEYISLQDGVILSEYWVIRIYNTLSNHLFDLSIRQENVTNENLILDQYIYGGMAFRGSAQWDPHNKKMFQQKWHVVTSEGIRDTAANNTAARWVTVSGAVDNQPAAATVIGHPSNFRYPQKIRVHPDMPYWVFSPVIDKGFTIQAAGTYTAKYRYFITNLPPTEQELLPLTTAW